MSCNSILLLPWRLWSRACCHLQLDWRWAEASEILIQFESGKDATEDFDEIGHSKSARELLSNYKIGTFAVSPDVELFTTGNLEIPANTSDEIVQTMSLPWWMQSRAVVCLLIHFINSLLQGGKPAAGKPSRGSAIKIQQQPGSSLLVTVLKVILPFVVIAAIFLPKLLKSEWACPEAFTGLPMTCRIFC